MTDRIPPELIEVAARHMAKPSDDDLRHDFGRRNGPSPCTDENRKLYVENHWPDYREDAEEYISAVLPLTRASIEAEGWRPIETATRAENERILVSDGDEITTTEWANGRFVVSPFAWEGDGDNGGLTDLSFVPTHWRPLPAPPKDSAND
jgi:hypothetical protein